MDNVFIEQQRSSLKYEDVYLQESETGLQVKATIGNLLACYNTKRSYSSLEDKTMFEVAQFNLSINGTLNMDTEAAA